MVMKCTKFTELMGPFVDGELLAEECEGLEDHVRSCPLCESRLEAMRALTRALSSLPVIEPTPKESYRLMNRIRAEMESPSPARAGRARLRVAAAALTLLVAASIGTTWVILAASGTATRVDVTSQEPGQTSVDEIAQQETGTQVLGQLAMADTTKPATSVSEKDYSTADLKNFHQDLGARLDFYSSYWYPAATSGLNTADLTKNQEKLTQTIADQAAQAGKNPDEAKKAVDVALEQAKQSVPLLPCYAEQAKVEGKDAWLISLSGPEDYLLFSNQELPKAMYMAAQGGEASLRISETLLNQLAAMVAPFYANAYNSTQAQQPGTAKSSDTINSSTAQGDFLNAPISQLQGELSPEQQQQFQAFLRQVATQSNNLDLLSSLEGLNYEQLLMLIQGNWSGLAEQGVDLTHFLVPPKRLYAVDAASGAVIWSGSGNSK
jgi:hypothetical protein